MKRVSKSQIAANYIKKNNLRDCLAESILTKLRHYRPDVDWKISDVHNGFRKLESQTIEEPRAKTTAANSGSPYDFAVYMAGKLRRFSADEQSKIMETIQSMIAL